MSFTDSNWRLIELEAHNAAMNMAIDEAILTYRSKEETPNTIRFYTWNPSAVSIGFFQSLHAEVDLQTCKEEGVDVVRRMTGGGAVFHDHLGEMTYSLIAGEKDPLIPKDILTSYQLICNCLIKGMKLLGVQASFQPVNDIVVSGKKISGNAQTRRLGVLLQHGTVLVDTNLDKMFRLLKVSDAKIRDKLITSAEKRVTTLKKELPKKPSFQDVAEALKIGFEQSLKIRLVKDELTSEEVNYAEMLRKEKYSSREWIFSR